MNDEVQKKKFLMKVGIITIMALILVFWILNIKNVFRGNSTAATGADTVQLDKMKNDLNAAVDSISQKMEAADAANTELKKASSSLVNELIIETNKVASSTAASSPVATSSPATFPISPTVPTSTPQTKSNCPAYINCMPTIGESRPCTIPTGCEGITQIAY